MKSLDSVSGFIFKSKDVVFLILVHVGDEVFTTPPEVNAVLRNGAISYFFTLIIVLLL